MSVDEILSGDNMKKKRSVHSLTNEDYQTEACKGSQGKEREEKKKKRVVSENSDNNFILSYFLIVILV